MAPPRRLATWRRAPSYHGMNHDLMERDDGYDSDSDGDSDIGDDDHDDDDHHQTPNPVSTSAPRPTSISTPTLSPSPSPRPVQAATGDVDPSKSLTRVSEDGIHTGARAGIAVGVVAAILLLFSAAYFLRRRYRNRQKTSTPPAMTHSIPPIQPPALPADTRTDSQILDELMNKAYSHQNGGVDVTDEKRRTNDGSTASGDVDEGVSFPYHQAKIRPSIASWLRRHHPLQLNSLSRWSSTTTSSVPTTPFMNRTTETVPPVPPVPAVLNVPGVGRQSSRFKSVWSDTTADSDVGGPTRHTSVMTVQTPRVAVQSGNNRESLV